MSAELTYNERGMVNFASYKVLPWWGQGGTIFQEEVSYETFYAAAGHDYPLELRPHIRELPDGTRMDANDSFYVWRPDTKKVLGTVGGSYEIVPNLEAFAPLKPLVDDGVLRLETGGVLRDGGDAWLMGQLATDKLGPEARQFFAGDEIATYLAVLANHTGRRKLLLGTTPVKIVCANTLGMAETDGQSRWLAVDHRKGAREKLKEAAAQMFGTLVERFEAVARHYRLLKDVYLDQSEFKKLVLDVVTPDPRRNPKFNPEAKLAGLVLERHEKKVAELKRMWLGGTGHTGQPTAWWAYNGVVEAIDFDRSLWPARAGAYRTASLLTGHLAQMKNEVLDNLVQYAQAL